MRAWSAASSATSARAGTSRTNGSPPKSPGSTMSAATSRRWPTASPGSAAGPISPTAPTGSPTPPNGPSARARSRRGCRDALHERLTQRFVDRRTAVLVRDIGARGADALPVTVAADGEVSVGPEPIGHLAGFDFRVDPTARLADKRLLLAAAERRLGDELDRRASGAGRRARQRVRADRSRTDGGLAVGWEGHVLARLAPGRSLLEPALRTARALDRLSAERRAALRARLERWVDAAGRAPSAARCKKLAAAAADQRELARRARARRDAGRCRRRAPAPRDGRASSPRSTRPTATRCTGSASASARSTSSCPALLKPAAQHWRAALLAVRAGQPMPRLPAAGAATLDGERRPARRRARLTAGSAATGCAIDLADRLATHAHQVRAAGGERSGRPCARDLPRPRRRQRIAKLMAEIGFVPRRRGVDAGAATAARAPRPRAPRPGNAFAALAKLKR